MQMNLELMVINYKRNNEATCIAINDDQCTNAGKIKNYQSSVLNDDTG